MNEAQFTLANARIFSIAAHSAIDQRRKYTGEPYWQHPASVARILLRVPHDIDMLVVALLHDVVEDTKITLDTIDMVFGIQVAEGVRALTDTPKQEGLNRAARKAIDRQRLAVADGRWQTVKVADLIDNTRTIVDYDPKFAVTYLKEKKAVLDVLTKADPNLVERARNQLEAAELKLQALKPEVSHE